ncbi:MAG: SEC-C domain-containing protein [Phycisphaerales bacterium]|nr:SEC-C domain-containing protein [Phycisphaerales bacterium]
MSALRILWNLLREFGLLVMHVPRRVFGSRNERMVKRLAPAARRIIELEPQVRSLTTEGDDFDEAFARRLSGLPAPDSADVDAVRAHQRELQRIRVELSAPLRARAQELAAKLAGRADVAEVREDAFAVLREASRRAQAHRHFHCQLIGGRVLHDGKIAEMRTGEGKTIVCHLAAFLKVLAGQKVHIVTVNDYLVKRDAEFAAPVFELLGYTVGYIQAQLDPGGAEGLRRLAYACNITYGTASEFGFDYLRDNMKTRLSDQVQGPLDFAIIDEVDSILIDEARTPLIISGSARDDVTRYSRANRVAEELVHRQDRWDRAVKRTIARYDGDPKNIEKLDDAMSILGYGGKNIRRTESELKGEEEGDAADEQAALGPDFLTDDQVEAVQAYEAEILQLPPAERYRRYFICDIERKQAHLTHDGVTIAQELLEMGSLYAGQNMEWPHLIENSLRAWKVYQRDRDYVVQDGKIIIVDTFTGRLMHGRQWSDGLHQAVEARERVTVKEETQTLATITIQNFFKLYKAIAGMTGTAATEANEFLKIYQLDVVEIPTNRPVNRIDHNDKVYRTIDHKYRAIVDEIFEVHRKGRPRDAFLLYDVFKALRPIKVKLGQSADKLDAMMARGESAVSSEGGVDSDKTLTDDMLALYDEEMGDFVHGRPILVGTTSVENSEKLSRMLTRVYGVEHEVLNAKQHAREAEIVAKGGHLHPGGRDGKQLVGNVTVATNMAGRGTDIKLALPVVHPKCRVPEQMPEGARGSDLFPAGVTKCCIHCEEYDAATNCAHCFKPKLDPRFPELGRNICRITVPCGLHIVGTERHESRRIDNQLRGRSGRQGDPGSSRFFLSLEDDLLKLFMGPWMLKMLEKYGFVSAAGSLEDKRLTKGIQKAQTKVEEKNFMIRKGLLEWDEPKDYQRREFYKHRQRILEGRNLRDLVLEMIRKTIETEVARFLSPDYPRKCAAEWVRTQLDVSIDDEAFDLDDVQRAVESIRRAALSEAQDQIRTSIGEYIDPDEPPQEWDVGGLARWAERSFKLALTQNHLRKMSPQEIESALMEAAEKTYESISLEGLSRFADEGFALDQLTDWAKNKFNVALQRAELSSRTRGEVADSLYEKVAEAYLRREIEYPVQNCLDFAYNQGQPGSAPAGEVIVRWVNEKFDLGWTLDDTNGRTAQDMYAALLKTHEDFLVNGRLREEVAKKTQGLDREAAAEWGRQRFRAAFNPARFKESNGDVVAALENEGREWLRYELTKLEQYMLLRLHDQAWKDHLLELDHLEHAIRQRPLGGDQTHPQSQFAIEGRELFADMWNRVNDRITDLIFRVRATPPPGGGAGGAPAASPTSGTGPGAGTTMTFVHQDATNAAFASGAADEASAMRAQNVEQKVETIRRQQPKVGRNEPCPCGSGKKYKQCCGKGG